MQQFEFTKEVSRGKVGISSAMILPNFVHARLVLNTILAAQFSVSANTHHGTPGGIYGEEVRLLNASDMSLGLVKDFGCAGGVTTMERQILSWYSDLLDITFITGMVGYPDPKNVWHVGHPTATIENQLQLISQAIVHSDWSLFKKGTTLADRKQFWEETYPKQLQQFLFAEGVGDYFLPKEERDIMSVVLTEIKHGIHLN